MMEVKPILGSLRRHKLIASLLVALVALTCAIVCNVAFMIQRQASLMSLPSGVAENQLVMLESISLDRHADQTARHKADLAALHALPGVEYAAAVNAVPFHGDNWTNGIKTAPDADSHVLASAFLGSPDELNTLGVHLVAGRDFRSDEYVPLINAKGQEDGLQHTSAAIVTEALARRLFHGENALGKLIYSYPNPMRIVGVVDHLLRPSVGEGNDNDDSTIFPIRPNTKRVMYVLRTTPENRARVLKQASKALYRLDNERVVRDQMSFTHMRAAYFHRNRSVINLLLASALGLMFVTALGITGLAAFWVQQRTRSIGIRRAVGATRADILRYFQTENFLIVGAGVVLGVILAMLLSLLLMQNYAIPRLPLWYLPVGAVALWLLGQLAVLHPALRAARVPPVVATRSV
jgi:putative ABC transport system permease protein